MLILSWLPLFPLFLQCLGFNYQFSFIVTNQLIRLFFHVYMETSSHTQNIWLDLHVVLFDLFKCINIFVQLKVAAEELIHNFIRCFCLSDDSLLGNWGSLRGLFVYLADGCNSPVKHPKCLSIIFFLWLCCSFPSNFWFLDPVANNFLSIWELFVAGYLFKTFLLVVSFPISFLSSGLFLCVLLFCRNLWL